LIQFLPPGSPPISNEPDLLTAIPTDIADLIGDDSVPGWVEYIGEVRPELVADPKQRRRLELCLAAADEVDRGKYGQEEAARAHKLQDLIAVSPSRFAEMYRADKAGAGPAAYERYRLREPKPTQLHRGVQAVVLQYAQTHKNPLAADVMRDQAYTTLRADIRAGRIPSNDKRIDRLVGTRGQIKHYLRSPEVQNDPAVQRMNRGRMIRRHVVSGSAKDWLEGQAYAVGEVDEDLANFLVQMGRGEAFAVRPHRGFFIDVIGHAIMAVVYWDGSLSKSDLKRLERRVIENRGYLIGPGGEEIPWQRDGIYLIQRTDRGRALWNDSAYDLVEDFGVVCEAAQVARGDRKPDVEEIIGEFQRGFDRLMPSYVGAKPEDRGLEDAGKIAIRHGLTIDVVEALSNQYIATTWMPMVHPELEDVPAERLDASDRLYGRRRWTGDPFWLRLKLSDDVGEAMVTNNGIWYLRRRYLDPAERDAADLVIPDELTLPPEVTRGRVLAGETTGLVRRISNPDDLRYLDITQDDTYIGRVFCKFFIEWGGTRSRPVSLWEYREWQKRRVTQRRAEQEAADEAAAAVKANVPPGNSRQAAADRARLRQSQERGLEASVGPKPPPDPPKSPNLRPAPRGQNVFKAAPSRTPRSTDNEA